MPSRPSNSACPVPAAAPQLALALAEPRTWGGARQGAGRKRGDRVQHTERPSVARRCPTHVTLRVRPDVPNLRKCVSFAAVEAGLEAILGRPGFRVVHFSAQKNHLHLLIEAANARALSRGVQALSIRIARSLNRAHGRSGPVFSERYHARTLRTPREVRNALLYVLQNHRRHATPEATRRGGIIDPGWLDPCSSAASFDGWRDPPESKPARAAPVSPPTFWLLTTGWRRHGLLGVDEVPPAAWH